MKEFRFEIVGYSLDDEKVEINVFRNTDKLMGAVLDINNYEKKHEVVCQMLEDLGNLILQNIQ